MFTNQPNTLRTYFFICFLGLVLSLSAQQETSTPLTKEINPLLLNSPWQASWIAHPADEGNRCGVFHFRKSIELKEKPAKFIVHVSADNRYWLYVNGKTICTGPAKNDLAHWNFESLDLAAYLTSGKNTIAAVVWNSAGFMPWSQITYKTGFLLQGNSQTEAIANTDATWKVYEDNAYMPLFDDFKVVGARELFMAQRYPFGWETPDFNDNMWSQAVVSEKAVPSAVKTDAPRKLVQRSVPLPEETMQRFATIRKMEGANLNDNFIKGTGDLKIFPWQQVTILIDQQTLTTAYPELIYSGGEGAKITLTYMEAPFINFRKEEKGHRDEFEGKLMKGIEDIIYPNGKEKRTYRPLYYRTFRYVEVKIANYMQPLVIHDFYSKFTAYPFKENASFNSSDASLKNIWNVGWRTARLCAYESYMDCPYYEQMQYIGDTRIQALISLYVSGDAQLMKNSISQFNNSRIPEGLTYSRYPTNLKQIIPPFSLFWALMVHDFWMHAQDDAFVKSQLDGVQAAIKWHTDKINPQSGMLGKLPYWNFVDWPKEWPWLGKDEGSGMPANSNNGNSSVHTLQLAYTLDKMVSLFKAYGYAKEADNYKKISEDLKKATYNQCWDSQKQMLASMPDKKEFSQHANVMAVLSETVKGAEAQSLMKRITTDTSIVQCTVYYRFYLNQAMKKAGLGNEYINMLTPWHDMLKLGLTTFAEKPEPSRSDCHGWSASPNYDLLATVMGIEPDAPGFAKVKINPHPGKLTSLSGKMPHPKGEISMSMEKSDVGKWTATVALPEGISGKISFQGKTIVLKSGENKIVF